MTLHCFVPLQYLDQQTTRFRWNSKLLDPVDASVGIGQGSALSPILCNLAIALVLFAFSKQYLPTANAESATSLVFFVNDGTIAQLSDSIPANIVILHTLWFQICDLFLMVGFLLKNMKLELQHFPAGQSPPFIDLPLVISPTISFQPRRIWRVLGFFLDQRLTFRDHIKWYTNKAMSTLRAFPLLGNSIRGISPTHKHTLFVSCIRPLLTYGCCIWYNPQKPQKYLHEPLHRTQNLAAR